MNIYEYLQNIHKLYNIYFKLRTKVPYKVHRAEMVNIFVCHKRFQLAPKYHVRIKSVCIFINSFTYK